jgi:uncharacterized protein (TIGR00251 family)
LAPPSFDLPLSTASDGVRIAVRLAPRSRADRIDGITRSPGGAAVLKVSVTAPPADGRANEALLRLLAGEWRVPLRDLRLVGGAKSRSKIVHLAGDPALLFERLRAALGVLARS